MPGKISEAMDQSLNEGIKKFSDLSSRTTELLFSLEKAYHNNVSKAVDKLVKTKKKEMKEELIDERLATARRNNWIKTQLEEITSAIWQDVRLKMILVKEEKKKELELLLSTLEKEHLQEMVKLRLEAENNTTQKMNEQTDILTKLEMEYESPCTLLHTISKACTTCGNTNTSELLACSGCGGVLYCNEACQRRDWARHQRECGE